MGGKIKCDGRKSCPFLWEIKLSIATDQLLNYSAAEVQESRGSWGGMRSKEGRVVGGLQREERGG